MIYDLKFKKNIFYFIWLFLVVAFFIFIPKAEAAIFSFDSQTDKIRLGDEFTIDLMLDTEKQEINAVEAKILFLLDILELKQISDGNSVINLWAQQPALATDPSGQVGAVSFSGIIPGGYNGYLGKRKILSLFFKAKNNGISAVSVTEERALLNDGLGTAASVAAVNFNFSISSAASPVEMALIIDQERPENFVIHLSNDAGIFQGKWFVVFATQDKKSGINHYEIAESRKNIGTDYAKLNWRRAESPQLLSDQSLADFVYVKAVDNQGNEKVSALFPAHPKGDYKIYLFWGIILILVISLHRGICRRKKQN